MILTLLSSTLEVWEEILVPICICVVLPCVIVYLVMQASKHDIDRRSEVALKAIEKGLPIEPCFMRKENKSVKKRIFSNLIVGIILLGLGAGFFLMRFALVDDTMFIPAGILAFLGAAFIVIYFIGRRHFALEIKAEEEHIGE